MARKIPLVLLSITIIVTGCSRPLTNAEKGALVGGAIGAGAGVIIGSETGHPGAGTVIGGAVGAVTGAVIADGARRAEPQVLPAPPPQQVVVATPPRVVVPTTLHMVWIPEWGVYVMEGHDIVYHQTSYYQYSSGYWWISQSYAGPWAMVVTPPPTIAKLPPGRLHSHPVRRAHMAAQASPPTAPVIVQAPPAVIVAAPPQAAPASPAPGQIIPAPRHPVYARASPPAVVVTPQPAVVVTPPPAVVVAPPPAVVVAPPVVAAAPPQPPQAPAPPAHGVVTPAPAIVTSPPAVVAPASPPTVVVPAPSHGGSAPAPPAQVAVGAPPAASAPERPHMIWVPEWGVHVLEGQDVVYYKEAYFSYSGGQWSISQSHAGPWAVVTTPPSVIAKLPPGQLHSHLPPAHQGRCPPGLAKQGRC